MRLARRSASGRRWRGSPERALSIAQACPLRSRSEAADTPVWGWENSLFTPGDQETEAAFPVGQVDVVQEFSEFAGGVDRQGVRRENHAANTDRMKFALFDP